MPGVSPSPSVAPVKEPPRYTKLGSFSNLYTPVAPSVTATGRSKVERDTVGSMVLAEPSASAAALSAAFSARVLACTQAAATVSLAVLSGLRLITFWMRSTVKFSVSAARASMSSASST